jgi:branched-chain amino acid transport system substrate-binding protein
MGKGAFSGWFSGQRGLMTVVAAELVVVSLLGWAIIRNTEPGSQTQALGVSTEGRPAAPPAPDGLDESAGLPAAEEETSAGQSPTTTSDAGSERPSVGRLGGTSGVGIPGPARRDSAGMDRGAPKASQAAGPVTSTTIAANAGGATAGGSASSAAAPGPVKLDRGVTDSTISIGAICHISGPLRLEFGCVGASAAVREINAAGGVAGRRLQYKFYDDGLDPQRTKAAVTKLLQEDKVFAWVGGWAPVTSNVTIPAFEQDQTPIVFPDSTDNLWFGSPWAFPFGTSVRGYGIAVCDYLLKTVKDPKLAVVYYDVRPSVQPKDACLQHLKANNVAPASVDQAQLGAPDFTNLVLKWRSLGVNGVAVFIEENSHVRLAQNMDQQGYWVPQVGNGTAASSTIAEQAPRGGEGITLVGPTKSYLGNAPIAERYRAAMKRYYANDRLHGLGMLAYAQVYQFADVFKLLGNEVTRANMKRVLDTINISTNGVLGVANLNYQTSRGKDFNNCFGPWIVRNKVWVDAGDWFCY